MEVVSSERVVRKTNLNTYYVRLNVLYPLVVAISDLNY